ncbi:MAG: S8 family serine peptidase [Niastella sp.]|nr:S8 family serine peptidase [Niastella sp.]
MNKIFSMIAIFLLAGSMAFAQPKKSEVPNNWFQLDPATSGYDGISLDKARELLKSKNLKSNRVIVAVIDSGIDTTHTSLKPVLWTNPGEIPGNGIDDDKNGYIDDVHGWNFIGGKDGRNVKDDSFEAARVYYALKDKWENKSVDENALNATEKAEYATYKRAKEKVQGDVNQEEVGFLRQLKPRFVNGDSIIRKELGKDEYNCTDLKALTTQDPNAKITKSILIGFCQGNKSDDITNTQLLEYIDGEIRKADAATTAPENYRAEIVKDNENDINDRYYGNNDIMANTPFHGTFCAGIIAGVKGTNPESITGIADNVRIMAVRAVPDGDEHDKDIALAIRYAVDNGAKIISMSFGKDFSPEKKWVDDAFKYAESKGVLLVHAAGNDHKNVDSTYNFPNPDYADGSGRASNIITVGASSDKKLGSALADFSNYGKKEVDVFAPGVAVYSTTPFNNSFGKSNGTSFAGPIVAGIAALTLQYYPNLTPQQLKTIIEKTAQAPAGKVNKPGSSEMVSLSDISVSGGIVDAYEAVKYAGDMKTPLMKNKDKKRLPKTKISKPKKG